MDVNDILEEHKDDDVGAINDLLIEGIEGIRKLQFNNAIPFLEKANSIALDLVLKTKEKELMKQYEIKFSDIFSKYTFALYLKNPRNPSNFIDVVSKFRKQNDEIYKELNNNAIESFLTDCDLFYPKYNNNISPTFYMTWNPFNYMIQKVESNNSNFGLQTLIIYLKIVKSCNGSLKPVTIQELCLAILNNFINTYNKELKNHQKKLRTVDETKFKHFTSLLNKLLKSGSNLKQLEKFENDVLFDFLLSDFVGKQFYALTRFNSYCTYSKDLVEQFKQKDIINKIILKPNLHHELIQQFSLFLSKLFDYGFYDNSIIELLWTKSFEKAEFIEDYFKAWPTIQSAIPQKSQKFFWNLVLTKTPSFSSPFVHSFLIQIAPNCSEKDKVEMVDLLYNSAMKSNNREEFVEIINEYIPTDNEYRDLLKNRCFSLFDNEDESDDENENEDKNMFALKLLLKIWRNVNENQTKDDFDFLLKNCKLSAKNASTFLTLLSTIATYFTHPLTDEELELTKQQITEIISVDSMHVFNFIQRLLTIQKGQLFTPALSFSLLEWLTKLPNVDFVIFKLIRCLYEMIVKHSKNNKNGEDTTDYSTKSIESLWDLLYKSDIPDVAVFVVKIYLMKGLKKYKKKKKSKKNKKKKSKSSKAKRKSSNDSDSEDSYNDEDDLIEHFFNDFIKKCFQKIECFGSLTALYFLVSEIEDSLDLEKFNIRRNEFNGYKQILTINLTQDYKGKVKIQQGTSYYKFRKIVLDLIKVNDTQITLMSGKSKLDRNHVFKNEENIKVFFDNFEEEIESPNVSKTDSDTDSDSDSEYSESFSFDMNSFEIDWNKEILPSLMLDKYRPQIKKLLDNEDVLICEASLNLLNHLSIDENEENLLKTKSDLFDVEHQFLFIYRLNLLANLIDDNNNIDVLSNVFNSDLYLQLVTAVFNKNKDFFNNEEYFDLLLEVVVSINKSGSDTKELRKVKRKNLKKLIKESDLSLESILNWIIEEEKAKPINTIRIINYLIILSDFIQVDQKILLENQRFPEFFDLTLFNDDPSIRVNFFNLLTFVKTTRIQDFFLTRLNSSRKKNCIEYFQIIQRIAKFSRSYENNKFLFETLVDSLNKNLFIFKNIKVKTYDKKLIKASNDLCADLAFPCYVKGIIDNLEFIFPLVYENKEDGKENKEENEEDEKENEEQNKEDEDELIKKPQLLLNILVNKIVFNTNRYVYSPPSLFRLVKMILNRFPSLFPPLIKSLIKFNNSIEDIDDSNISLFPSDRCIEKGLNNMGCTCYLNASIQQLFHIKEIRNAIFSYDPTNDITDNEAENDDSNESFISSNWICQLQLLMADLKYAPLSSVNTTGFVSNWKMYGNEPINPNEQQDAVEFLQLLLDRLDESIAGKPISKIARGQIIHTIKQINGDFQSQSYEDFITFALEVINKKNFDDSFNAFLEPDIFDGDNKYNVEDLGQIDASRYHAIKKAPKILIFQLKRFDFDLSSLRRRKINSEYKVDLEVDISKILWNKNENNDVSCVYELFGIIEHSGNTDGGHYISLIKNTDIHDENESQWKSYNDSRVYNIDEKEVLKKASGGTYTRRFLDPITKKIKIIESPKIDSAYILFYRKKSSNDDKPKKDESPEYKSENEEEEEEENETEVKEDSDEPIQFMPEIMLRKFFNNMKNLILRHVMFSNEYINFIDYISKVDNFDTFSFIYKYTMKSIMTSTNFKKSSIIQTVLKKANTDVNFARYILKRENNDVLINALLNFTNEKQATLCCKLAESAISVIYSNKKENKSYKEDEEFIDGIIASKEEIINHTDNLDFIFRPFLFYLVQETVSFDLAKKYLDFFIDLFESMEAKNNEINMKNKSENARRYKSEFLSSSSSNKSNIKIGDNYINTSYYSEYDRSNSSTKIDFKNINMTHVFRSIVYLIENNDFEGKDKDYYESIKNKIISKKFIEKWSKSRYHSFIFYSFVIHFLKDDKSLTDAFFDFICGANNIKTGKENDKEIKPKGKVKFKLNNKAKNDHHFENNHHTIKASGRDIIQKMSIQSLSAIFVNLLLFKDSLTTYRIDWFLEFTDKLKWSQLESGNFLKESSMNIKNYYQEADLFSNFVPKTDNKNVKKAIIDPYSLFDCELPHLITKFLLSSDQYIRGYCISFIYSLFPSFPMIKISNGMVYTETSNYCITMSDASSDAIPRNNQIHFVRECDKTQINFDSNENSDDSDATESSGKSQSAKDDEKSDVCVNEQKMTELKTIIKIFTILINMIKDVAAQSKEIASNIESYHGFKAIPTDSFFELLSWASFSIIDYSGSKIKEIQNEFGDKLLLNKTEIEFLEKFDLSKYSETFSDLIIKFSSFKNNIRCSVIDLLRFIFIIFIKGKNQQENEEEEETEETENEKKKNVLIDSTNASIYLNALSKFPPQYEMTSFIDNAAIYFLPIITPFVSKIESCINKSKFIEVLLKSALESKAYNPSIKSVKNHNDKEENYYNTAISKEVNSVNVYHNRGDVSNVVSNLVQKMKISEKLCSILWKKRKEATWGKSSLLLKITYDILKRNDNQAIDYFIEYNCIFPIITEFEILNEIQQVGVIISEMMLQVVHAYNLCFIRNDNENKGEEEEEEEKDSSVENKNVKILHNFDKKFNRCFVDVWKNNFKFLSIVQTYLKRSTVNYCQIALKVLNDVFVYAASHSPEIAQFAIKTIIDEVDSFYMLLKTDKIREKYAKMEIKVININKNEKQIKKKKNSKSDAANGHHLVSSDTINNLVEREAKRLLKTEVFDTKLFMIFLNEIKNDETKSKLLVEFLSKFNEAEKIDESFAQESIDFLKNHGFQLKKVERSDKVVLTKKEKKKIDAENKENGKTRDVENIINNINNLIEAEIKRINKRINYEKAKEILARLISLDKLLVLINDSLNANARFAPSKKLQNDQIMNCLLNELPNKAVYENLYQIVEKILYSNVNKE